MSNHVGNVTSAASVDYPIHGRGTIQMDLQLSSGEVTKAILEDVLYVPGMTGGNLISESVLDRKGYEIVSKDGTRRVFKNGKECMFSVLNSFNQFVVQGVQYKSSFASYLEAHECFGHPGQNAMLHLKRKYPSQIPNKPEQFHCPACVLSKSTHEVGNSRVKRAENPFDIVHSDLSGKFSVESLGRKRYYISFIDDFTRYAWIYFIRSKDDTYDAIRQFVKRIQNQHGITIKKVFSDNGGEYIDRRVEQFFGNHGIDHEFSPPYEHESNGVAERFNRTIVTKARTMLLDLPKFLWAEAIATAVYLYNRTPHRTIDYQSP
ncbi:hypothetical protein K3495_g16156, partial [Podosphaera aphanis]